MDDKVQANSNWHKLVFLLIGREISEELHKHSAFYRVRATLGSKMCIWLGTGHWICSAQSVIY